MLIILYIAIFLLFGPIQQAHAEIVLSEIYPAPSQGYEWVEVCNDSDQPISLTSYTLHDSGNRAIFMPHITLQPDQYVLATSSGVLNNTGDSVYLRKNSVIIETMTYDQSVTSTESFIQCSGVWSFTTNVTPGFRNPSCGLPTSTPTPEPSQTITPTGQPQLAITTTPKSPSPTKSATTTLSPAPPTNTTLYAVPTPQLFAEKHRPIVPILTPAVLAAHKEAPTPTTFILSSPSPKKETHFLLIMLVSVISTGITGYLIYQVVQKMKDSYNEWHDT